MRQTHIQIQDPSLSPTFNLSSTLPQSTSPTHAHVRRRNLFSSNLSRRPQVEPFSVSHSPSVSSRSASPPKPALVISQSIIALDSTGRPQLPDIPALPARLEPDGDDESGSEPEAERDREREQKFDLVDLTTGDYDRIEAVLAEMQSMQRARARGSDGVKTRRKMRKEDGPGGVGATMKPEDKEEILGLIMSSLRKRFIEAEEEAWMFGDERLVGDTSGFMGARIGPDED